VHHTHRPAGAYNVNPVTGANFVILRDYFHRFSRVAASSADYAETTVVNSAYRRYNFPAEFAAAKNDI
jgi:hypothetical protein